MPTTGSVLLFIASDWFRHRMPRPRARLVPRPRKVFCPMLSVFCSVVLGCAWSGPPVREYRVSKCQYLQQLTALSAFFKVDAAPRRVGGENDYICYVGNCGIYKISKKVDGALGMSSWRNRRAPLLSDNAAAK